MSADFIDTNVFIHLFDETDPKKREVSRSLLNEALASGSGRTSFQVVQESLNVLTTKFGAITDVPASRALAITCGCYHMRVLSHACACTSLCKHCPWPSDTCSATSSIDTVVDEPTGNLPQEQWGQVLDLFEAEWAKGKTVIIVTHEPAVAARAKRTVRLRDGRLDQEVRE